MAVVIFFGLFTGYKVVYAAESDLSDYEKEILNAYLNTLWYDSNRWINIYSYKGIEYDFLNCKVEQLNFDYNDYEENLSVDGGAYDRFIYTSYEKKYDVLKKMDYLAIDGLLILQDHTEGNTFRFENFWRSDVCIDKRKYPNHYCKDCWGVAWLPEIIIYRVTLGIYIKEVDGKLYAYGEKYKFKDITEKNIVTPEELTEEEYINFATWVKWEYYDSTFKMEDMYGLETPTLRKFTYRDLFLIPITKGSMSNKRYFPVEYSAGHILVRG